MGKRIGIPGAVNLDVGAIDNLDWVSIQVDFPIFTPAQITFGKA